ncbi:XRE family transcriptional regulator [Apilactobacillus timberlakei]|uniref:helix-turn-helix domain-containing protein n=1 Tax=Apilactobacillus timberlakei TaxID=2008380 RepID=UPI0011286CDD|nr:helix-turn-helix transcriptional regulator [Apilactobacillus timberlakei]TPR19648.1 XRE family transcriptional regulator [Apilactobacillus timberlakei]TPR20625.1 XRE family transcriptional regulator [Apilactobacillus timberlakei]TPR22668.1 XRE family transcriptional regulator [Apilactobacillus timberlakei]TPR23184.1 XRE family transcriptional regulator [Apilactobacillus timberlakei]
MINKRLGTLIKDLRIKKHISQRELSYGICTQPLISEIEHSRYIPNGIILLKIFKKLNVSLDEITLNDDFEISYKKDLNLKLNALCNKHEYEKMYELLNNKQTILSINNDFQEQAYYYYLGISLLQAKNDLANAIINFKLSISSRINLKNSDTLVRLSEISLAYIYSLKKHKKITNHYIKKSINGINKLNFTTNYNIIFYLAALSKYKLGDYRESTNIINQFIDFAKINDSHYMLSNTYYLLSIVASITGEQEIAIKANNYQHMLNSLFKEKIFRKI